MSISNIDWTAFDFTCTLEETLVPHPPQQVVGLKQVEYEERGEFEQKKMDST
jgi:hypothetical protein